MPDGSFPRYTITELERIGAQLLRERFASGATPPIDIEFLIESDGYVIEPIRDLKRRCGVAGAVMAHPSEDRFTIVVDEAALDGNETFSRFTLAEEFSHLVLHREVLRRVRTIEDVVRLHRSPSYYDVLDRNAKRLASIVLMPEQQLATDCEDLFGQLRQKMHVQQELQHRLTIRMAQQYAVSTNAMLYRLEGWPLGIFERIGAAFAAGAHSLPPRS